MFYYSLNAFLAACSAGSLQCPASGICISNAALCDGQIDCRGSILDESPIICGESKIFIRSKGVVIIIRYRLSTDYTGCISVWK